MDFDNIQNFRQSRITEYLSSQFCFIHYYAGTNPITSEDEKIFIIQRANGVCNLEIENCFQRANGVCNLEIENCSYTGNLEEMEDILWQWWHEY